MKTSGRVTLPAYLSPTLLNAHCRVLHLQFLEQPVAPPCHENKNVRAHGHCSTLHPLCHQHTWASNTSHTYIAQFALSLSAWHKAIHQVQQLNCCTPTCSPPMLMERGTSIDLGGPYTITAHQSLPRRATLHLTLASFL
jgi:hypothetical protein